MNTTVYLILLCDFLAAMLVGAMLTRFLLYIAYRKKIFDLPGERKVQSVPVPRVGGMAFFPTLVIVTAFTISTLYRFDILNSKFLENMFFMRLTYLLGSAVILYLVGLADDLTGVNFKVKFLCQFMAAFVIALSGLWFHRMYGLFGVWEISAWVGIPTTIMLLVFVMNAINLIDGIDGLASGLGIISLACFSVIFIYEKRFVYAMTSVITLGALCAFWLYNMFGKAEKKTKLYMGDTGTLTLGLIISFLIIGLGTFTGHNGMTRNCKYLIIAFSSLMIPMLDVIRLVFYRLRHHRNPFLPDMNHVHHKLMQVGLTPRQALWTLLGTDILLIGLNAFLSMYINVNILLVIDILIYLVLVWALTSRIVKKQKDAPAA